MSDYVLDNAWQHERDRLDSMTGAYDDDSLAFCLAAGLAPGWRCLEVGPGTGRFAQRLADVVGETGHVLAVDIDTRLAAPVARSNLEVRQLDLRTEPLPQDEFDLVHGRLVVEHLPDRENVIARLVGALKPGGWLVLEDFDRVTASVCEPPSAVHAKVHAAVYAVMRGAGMDDEFGRRLVGHVRRAGLTDVTAYGWVQSKEGDPEIGMPQWSLLVNQLRVPMLASGAVTEADIAEFDALLHDPTMSLLAPLLMRVRGRRP